MDIVARIHQPCSAARICATVRIWRAVWAQGIIGSV
jgi:hypothetical protein